MKKLILLLLLLTGTTYGKDWYASPTGLPTNDGTINKPWDLGTAFISTQYQPGDNLILRGGLYRWDDRSRWQIRFSGANEALILVHSYPGELAVLDTQLQPPSPDVGWFQVFGSNLRFQNIRFTCSSTRPRVTSVSGSAPWAVNPNGGAVDPLSFRGSVRVFGDNVSFVNCIIDNLNEGIAHQQNIGGGVYGCVIYHNGWVAPDRPHGHGIYLQNRTATPNKVLSDNVCFSNYSCGIHAFGTEAPIDYVTGTYNICFNNFDKDLLFASYSVPMKDLIVQKNFSNNGKMWIGYVDSPVINTNAKVLDNFMPGSIVSFGKWGNILNQNNIYQFSEHVSILPNKYEIGRAHIVAYSNKASITCDLSNILLQGKPYQIYRIWDLNTPILTGTYGSPITIPMAESTIKPPVSSTETNKVMPANFGVFLVKSEGLIVEDPETIPQITPIQIVSPTESSVNVGQVVTFQGTGDSLVWNIDVAGSHNPSPFKGNPYNYTVPVGATKLNVTLTGIGGTVSRSYNVGTSIPEPTPLPQVNILEPVEGTTLIIGQTVTFKGTGENLTWIIDVVGAGNPPNMTGNTVTYTIPTGTTKLNVTLKGSTTVTRSYNVVSVIPTEIVSPTGNLTVGTHVAIGKGDNLSWSIKFNGVEISKTAIFSVSQAGTVTITLTGTGGTVTKTYTVESPYKPLQLYILDGKLYVEIDGAYKPLGVYVQ